MPCRFHPDREAAVKCSKLEIGYCLECLEDCMACTDPCGYSRFEPPASSGKIVEKAPGATNWRRKPKVTRQPEVTTETE